MAFSKEKAHERAEKFAAKGQHDKAAREYQSIVDNDPKDIRAWLMLADCLARTGDRNSALQRYLQVADYYAGAKEHQKALAVYRQALNIDPNRLDVHYKCAQLNMEIGRVHDAIASFEQIAAVQLQTGHVSEALKTYRVIADADATIVSKRLRLAELYSRERLLVEAVDAFRVAGDVLLQSGRKSDYVRVAERLIYHKNDDRPTIRKLARVYLELGDPRRALMKLNALLQADQHDREGLELLAETFIALGKPDKATSVIAELTRDLLAAGTEGAAEAHRVLARGLDWEPADPVLLRLRDEMEGGTRPPASRATGHTGLSPRAFLAEEPSPADPRPSGAEGAEPAPVRDSEPMELDLDDSDVVELVDEDDVDDDEPAPHDEAAAIPQEMPASITDEVMSEVAPGIAAREVGGDDFDKILFEARVYIKYRLFDHSLDHIQGLLDQRPQHVGALGLKARALTELQRVREAADTHVQVAQLVMGHDPKLALTHLAAALEASPHHAAAVSLEAQLRGAGAADTGPKPAVRVQDDSGLVVDGAGDSGVFAFDEDEDEEFEGDSDFSIEVSDSEEVATPPARPRVVENRFGISEAGPLPDDDHDRMPVAREATPAAGFIPRPPDPQRFEQKRPRLGDLDLRDGVDMDRATGRFDAASQQAEDHEDEGSFANVLDDQSEQIDIPRYTDVDESGFPLVREPAALSQELDAGFDELMREESQPVDIRHAPAGAWTDLSDDLAEIRFYLDQGLDDDARAAIEALGEDHPGHPQLAALSREIDAARAEKVSFDSGSKPLLDLVTEEDQEADAYLSAIFEGGGGKKKKQPAPAEGRVEVTAVASEGESNARDHFDLGTAYREMGLVDGAITEFEAAATDPNWKSRALVMVAILQSSRGDNNEAIGLLERAIDAAMSDAERCEAMYELAVLFEKLGDKMAAIEQFEAVEQGYRDRDERLVALQG